MMKAIPDLLQIQADLVEVAESLERMRATVRAIVERQRVRERPTDNRFITDAQGVVSVRED